MTKPAQAMSMSQKLSQYWSTCRFDDLPAEVIKRAKTHLTDTLAAGLRGMPTPVASLGRRAVIEMNGASAGGVGIWGTSLMLPPSQAALLNGIAAHALELDDFGGCGHSGAVVVPAVLACIQMSGMNGRQLLLAMIGGYDVAARTLNAAGGYTLHNELGWHSTGTCGSFGAAMGAALALGLDAKQTCHALGTAGTFTGGTWAFSPEGAMTKRYHPGRAAENGVTAAFLARAGFEAPTSIYEEPWGGFLATYCRRSVGEDVCESLGSKFCIMESGIKAYSCCRGIHSSLDALRDAMSMEGISSDDIATIQVSLRPQNARMVGGKTITNILEAQMSLPYSLAVAALRGQALVNEYDSSLFAHPHVRDFIERISISADLPDTFPEDATRLTIKTRDGTAFSRSVDIAIGGPEKPLDETEVRAKARALIGDVREAEDAECLFEIVDQLEHLPNLNRLWAYLGENADHSG